MKVVFFDLDNTLYDAKQYYLGAFREISDYLAERYDIFQEKIYKSLTELWQEKTSNYLYLFNDLLKILAINNKGLIKEIVEIFNEHEGKLKLYPDAFPVLRELKEKGHTLGIITDGNKERQKRKIELLSIKDFFAEIIYAKEIMPKPSEKPFLAAREKYSGKVFYYVADNPLIDFQGAKKAGMITIRLKKGEFAGIPSDKYVDFEIKKLRELFKIIGHEKNCGCYRNKG